MCTETEMTDAEVDRLDCIWNKTERYIREMLPKGAKLEIEPVIVNAVIEAVWDIIKNRVKNCTEMQFYPYRDHEGENQ